MKDARTQIFVKLRKKDTQTEPVETVSTSSLTDPEKKKKTTSIALQSSATSKDCENQTEKA